MVIRELARIAFADLRKVMDWNDGGISLRNSDDLSDDDAPIISEISFKPGHPNSASNIRQNWSLIAESLICTTCKTD